jgi:hypothetical protein
MKKPENFRKINGVKFATKTNNEYKFATDGTGVKLWVFQQPDDSKYCLAFVIDWKTETYEIKRAENGKGTNWIDTIHQGNFGKDSMKTMSSFVDWAHHRILQFEYEYNKL